MGRYEGVEGQRKGDLRASTKSGFLSLPATSSGAPAGSTEPELWPG